MAYSFSGEPPLPPELASIDVTKLDPRPSSLIRLYQASRLRREHREVLCRNPRAMLRVFEKSQGVRRSRWQDA